MSIPQPDTDARQPTLGAMFRLIHAGVAREYARWLETTAHAGIRPAHAAILQPLWQVPAGERLTTLAASANITKQSAGALVDGLLGAGYVERFPDPADARAVRIRLTARGQGYVREVRQFGRDFEARLARRLGADRLERLRGDLDLLWQLLQDPDWDRQDGGSSPPNYVIPKE